MATGSVIRYDGKRGVVWRIKYTDADGKQTMETIGAECDGVTERQAREQLADRLSDVRRKGYRRPQPLTFNAYVDRWFEEGKLRRGWKPRTVKSYRTGLRHLKRYFGRCGSRRSGLATWPTTPGRCSRPTGSHGRSRRRRCSST